MIIPFKHPRNNWIVDQEISYKMPIFPPNKIETEYFSFDLDRNFILKKGYAFDGCSGAAIDENRNLLPCAFHDAFFQCIREGLLPEIYFEEANKIFYQMLIEQGFSKFRAWYYWKAVDLFGKKYARKQIKRVD